MAHVKTYKVKLNVKSPKRLHKLMEYAGAYRLAFNSAMETQIKFMHCSGDSSRLTETELYDFIEKYRKQNWKFFIRLDKSLVSNACRVAHFSFSKWWKDFTENRKYIWNCNHLSRKKDNMKFKVDKIRVKHGSIVHPYLGEFKIFEKGYIPEGYVFNNITFSHDGVDWYVSMEDARTKAILTPSVAAGKGGPDLYLDFDDKGNILVNGKALKSVVDLKSYKDVEKRKKRLERKLRRQATANYVEAKHYRKYVVRTSRNMMKTRKAVAKCNVRLNNLRKNFFRQAACEVAKTKPGKLHILSDNLLKWVRQKGLSLRMREAHTREFFNIIFRKLRVEGWGLHRHFYLHEFLRAPG